MAATLKPIAFHHKSASGEELKFSSSVTVDQNGQFSVSVPEELWPSLEAEHRSCAMSDGIGHSRAFSLKQTSKNHWVSSSELATATAAINTALRNHLQCEVTRERVILYGTDVRVAYVLHDDGSIHPNGYFVGRDYPDRARFRGKLNANARSPHYQIGLCACVRDVVTYKRPTTRKVIYELVRDESQEGVRLLNSFVGLSIKEEALQAIPYSEEAARFFFDSMISILELAHRIEGFFANTANITAAIAEQRQPLLLAAASPD